VWEGTSPQLSRGHPPSFQKADFGTNCELRSQVSRHHRFAANRAGQQGSAGVRITRQRLLARPGPVRTSRPGKQEHSFTSPTGKPATGFVTLRRCGPSIADLTARATSDRTTPCARLFSRVSISLSRRTASPIAASERQARIRASLAQLLLSVELMGRASCQECTGKLAGYAESREPRCSRR
jgi:hypothetical protein